MNFAGNKFAYVSKRKVARVNELKANANTNTNLMDVVPESMEEDLTLSAKDVVMTSNKKEIEKKTTRRSKKRDLNKSKSRSRSNSLTKNVEKELDEAYSDEEEDDDDYDNQPSSSVPQSSSSGLFSGIGNAIKNIFTHKCRKGAAPQKVAKKKRKVLYQVSNDAAPVQNEFEHIVDTNVMSIKFEFLKDKVAFATGDPQRCAQCEAILSNISTLTQLSQDINNKFLWTCEFCGKLNELTMEPEEIPTTNCVDFFIQSVNQGNKQAYNYNDEQSLIFCFDISGSMCVSTPIAGKYKFKGSCDEKKYKDLMTFSDGSDQFFSNQARNMTYVSRLQCLQAAIEQNLSNIMKSAPNRKVGFVAFNNEVVAYGDGTKQPVTINGNNLNDYDAICKIADDNAGIISAPLKDSSAYLLKQLYSIEESGQTALGPAILFSIAMIKDQLPGSRIILCTDGISNTGLGAMEDKTEQKDLEDLKAFYTQLGILAKEKGIVVNLITFEEEESKIEILMTMIDQTGGEIIRVKPTEILEQFSNLLTNEIVATNVKINVKLHKAMCFRNEDSHDLKDDGSTLTKEIGNATKESEMYIEYSFKKSEDIAEKYPDVDLDKMTSVPFQSIIEYTTPNGDKCIRAVTDSQQLTSSKDVIENQAKYEILSTNAIKKTAKLAQEGKYREAQSNALAWKKYINNQAESNEDAYMNYNIMKQNLNSFNNELQEMQYVQQAKMPNPKTKQQEKMTFGDKLSTQIHQLKNSSAKTSAKMYFDKKKKK